MKMFCECNSEWIVVSRSKKATSRNDVHIMVLGKESCKVCGFHFWYEPHYENEQFDLFKENPCVKQFSKH